MGKSYRVMLTGTALMLATSQCAVLQCGAEELLTESVISAETETVALPEEEFVEELAEETETVQQSEVETVAEQEMETVQLSEAETAAEQEPETVQLSEEETATEPETETEAQSEQETGYGQETEPVSEEESGKEKIRIRVINLRAGDENGEKTYDGTDDAALSWELSDPYGQALPHEMVTGYAFLKDVNVGNQEVLCLFSLSPEAAEEYELEETELTARVLVKPRPLKLTIPDASIESGLELSEGNLSYSGKVCAEGFLMDDFGTSLVPDDLVLPEVCIDPSSCEDMNAEKLQKSNGKLEGVLRPQQDQNGRICGYAGQNYYFDPTLVEYGDLTILPAKNGVEEVAADPGTPGIDSDAQLTSEEKSEAEKSEQAEADDGDHAPRETMQQEPATGQEEGEAEERPQGNAQEKPQGNAQEKPQEHAQQENEKQAQLVQVIVEAEPEYQEQAYQKPEPAEQDEEEKDDADVTNVEKADADETEKSDKNKDGEQSAKPSGEMKISIDGVEDGASVQDPVNLTFTCEGEAYEEGSCMYMLEGTSAVPDAKAQAEYENNDGIKAALSAIEADGYYRLHVQARSRNGRREERTVRFTVNRGGSLFEADERTAKELKRYAHEKAFALTLIERNLDEVETAAVMLRINGELRVLDGEKEFTRSGRRLEDGRYEYQYCLPAQLFDEAGDYEVYITSRDKAGNISSSEAYGCRIAFSIEKPYERLVQRQASIGEAGVQNEKRPGEAAKNKMELTFLFCMTAAAALLKGMSRAALKLLGRI